jgi:LPPG:FO 2-phospho-L-lactate transferase
LHRTRLLREGMPLSQIAADIARAFGVGANIIPMSDDPVRTIVETDAGDLPFQEYLVKRHTSDEVRSVRFDEAGKARPAPGVLEAIANAEAIFIAPSNPIGSIGPIFAVPGVREAIREARVRCVAVSPIVGGRSLQPPAGEMMAGLGVPVDVTGVAQIYAGLIDSLIIDSADAARVSAVESLRDAGVRAIVANTIMRDGASRRALAVAALEAAGISE